MELIEKWEAHQAFLSVINAVSAELAYTVFKWEYH